MYYKRLKDMEISALGMGGIHLPTVEGDPNRIDREKGQEIVDELMRQGINFFDTAYIYLNGDSERFYGEALKKYPRESYYLSTKYSSSASPDIAAVFEEQLRRCQTEYFDFYLLHCLDEESINDYADPGKDYIGYLLKQKEAGRIRNIGFSTHAAPEVLRRFLDYYDGFDMALMQLNYVDWTLLRAKEQYEILTGRGIPVWVMEPNKGGRLTTLNDEAAAILRAAAPERSLASWAFRFLMGLDNVHTVLSGMGSLEHLADNLATFSKCDPLSAAELAALEKAKDAFLKDLGIPCSACRYCCSHCPQQLDIPLLIRCYNEYRVSGKTWRAATDERVQAAEKCLKCGACAAHCPQNIDIPDVLEKLATRKET